MSDRSGDERQSSGATLAVLKDETVLEAPADRSYRMAAIVGLCGGLLAVASGFMAKYRVINGTYSLLPRPGPGYLRRLGVNVSVEFVMPIVVLVACSMLLRARSRKDRWSGMLLGGGLSFGVLAANRLLGKPFISIEWLAGSWIQTTAYVVMFLAALMVGVHWFVTRTPRAGPRATEKVAPPPPP
jgi:hypothetical protein